MRFRLVTLLVAIHIALDFASPMMPGAVNLLDDGSLETDAGCYGRSAEDPAPAVTPLPRPLSSVVSAREPTFRAERVISAAPPAPFLFSAPVLPRSTLASSPDDD
jgi:hypothetical protein